MRRRTLVVLTVLASLSFFLTLTFAANTGQITGCLTDQETGKPIVGASVVISGTSIGAMTDHEGKYQITRVEPGVYTLRISHLDYAQLEIPGVTVSADSATEINRTLSSSVIDSGTTIEVTAKHDVIDKSTTSKRMIQRLPVASVDAILKQVAGVRTGKDGKIYIRGGRSGEVSYIISGKAISNPLGGLDNGVADRLRCGNKFPPAHGGSAIVNGEKYDAMFFENYGVNPFVDTEDDHYSTFAIDVDDASFILARTYLNRGHLPPKAAIRVEEFVNHFDYSYDPPSHETFRVIMEGAPSRFGPNGSLLMRIGIKGRIVQDEDRKPANLVFVIDVSGSMDIENRLELVKKSLTLMTERLTERDRLGIVIYGSNAVVKMRPTNCDRRQYIKKTIESVRCGGSTNAAQGINLGFQMASEIFVPGHINRVILCSDGVANVGVTGAEQILENIKAYTDQGITLTTVGFGMGNYNDILMEKLGNKGNGKYAYVNSIKEARRLFVEKLTGTLEDIAREVKTQVDFNPEVVRSYRLLGYENRDVDDDKFRDDSEDGGEIGAGHSATVLYELKLHQEPTSGLVANVFIRYQDPESETVTEIKHPFYMSAFTPDFDSTSDDFRLAAVAGELAEILRGSYWARDAKLEPVLEVVQGISGQSDRSDISELETLIMKAARHNDKLAER